MLDRPPPDTESFVEAETVEPVVVARKPFGVRVWLRIRRMARILVRGLSSSLTRRIIVLNLAGLITMLVGFLWLNQTREGLIDARVQSLLIQGEIIAGAVAASATVEGDTVTLDIDKLLQLQAGETAQTPEDFNSALEFSLNPERVAPILRRLVTPTRTRARVFDRDGNLLVDSRDFFFRGNIRRQDLPPLQSEGTTLLERSWNSFKRRFGRVELPVSDELSTSKMYPEVMRALQQAKTATVVRINSKGQTFVFVAVPIQRFKIVRGALLLSTQEGDIDQVIARERMGILLVFGIASVVILVLSILLAGTIAEPIRRLADAAERMRRGGKTRLRLQIPDYSARSDEIGHLSVALREMTRSLYGRIEAIESFAADVAHELKNPLTSLRSAVETLPLARNEESRARLLAVVQHDVLRLDRLISDISDASRLDAELGRLDAEPVNVARVLETVVSVANGLKRECGVSIVLVVKPSNLGNDAYLVMGQDSRLGQVFNNLIDNARSFSEPGSSVRVTCSRSADMVQVIVDDDGPGIPERALTRIFERFYTDRPDQGFGQNSGLGLSISRQIVEAHRGRIVAQNRTRKGTSAVLGARFVVTLPALAGRTEA